MTNVKCMYCGEEFYRRPSYVKKHGNNVCCSIVCSSLYRRSLDKLGDRICLNCGKAFRTNPAYIRRRPTTGGKYCSRSCFLEHKKRNATVSQDSKGYLVCRGKRVHRETMEQFLERKLESWEDVHHINGNKQDNRVENLEILSHSEHSKRTNEQRRQKKHRRHH
jgi:hypothetical protein